MQITVVLHNIRSAYNVGAILRSCDGFGVQSVILSGYTPRLQNEELLPHVREKLDHQIGKTALGAERTVPIKNIDDIKDELHWLRVHGYQVVGLENNIESDKLIQLPNISEKLKGNVVLVLGEEVSGIPKNLYDEIDIFAEIPMSGQKESFNVSVSAGIALYEITRNK